MDPDRRALVRRSSSSSHGASRLGVMMDGTRRIAAEHVSHYREHGYAIVEGFLITDAELAGARSDLKQAVPGWSRSV